ncbi:hypothetical protein LTR36_001757 [Oleoguttula mirabilis]|uniref:DUF1772-domain-containing protein n=1 Tax=Oleoguttula mirabilis TaxID=1507867 RepID=A0AAV9JLZ7_9PEZI|nr:hypothetical protein LTR36_001757 [Oleoguttula mirabilis]
MPTAIALCKFVGTISLGLLTGVSYTLSTQSLPSLLTLPSAKPAAYTLSQTARLATLHIRTLSAISTLSLALAFYLSPSRVRHPYLLWTALLAASSGALNLAMRQDMGGAVVTDDVDDVNGEQVEKKAREQQWIEFVRMGVSGAGFVMGVVGIWGDGA